MYVLCNTGAFACYPSALARLFKHIDIILVRGPGDHRRGSQAGSQAQSVASCCFPKLCEVRRGRRLYLGRSITHALALVTRRRQDTAKIVVVARLHVFVPLEAASGKSRGVLFPNNDHADAASLCFVLPPNSETKLSTSLLPDPRALRSSLYCIRNPEDLYVLYRAKYPSGNLEALLSKSHARHSSPSVHLTRMS